MPDFTVENHGSIWLVTPMSRNARATLLLSVGAEAQWFGGSLAVEPRYVSDLMDGLRADGWEVAA